MVASSILIIILLILALLSFIGAAANVNSRGVNLIGLGLTFWLLTVLIGGGPGLAGR